MTISDLAKKLCELDKELTDVNANLNYLSRVICSEYERKEKIEKMINYVLKVETK